MRHKWYMYFKRKKSKYEMETILKEEEYLSSPEKPEAAAINEKVMALTYMGMKAEWYVCVHVMKRVQ